MTPPHRSKIREEIRAVFYASSEKRAAPTPELSFHEGRDPVARLAIIDFLTSDNRSPNGSFLSSLPSPLGPLLGVSTAQCKSTGSAATAQW